MNDFACIRGLFPTGLLYSFELADVLLKTWMTASPLEEKWTEPWDVLLTTPTMIKLAEIKPWIHHTRLKRSPEEQLTCEPQENLKVIFQKQ